MSATTALREALNQGISSGHLVDTKIILYSHRDSSGRVCRPKALYANSCVLKTVPYFNDCKHSATLDTTHAEPHIIGLKYSSGISKKPSQKTSRNQSTKRNLQKTTGICPTATWKTTKMRGFGCSSEQQSRKFFRSETPLEFQARTRSSARTTRNASKKGR